MELPGGGIKTSGGEILVRMKERRDYGQEFARIPIIASNDGTQVFLEDIAVIRRWLSSIPTPMPPITVCRRR